MRILAALAVALLAATAALGKDVATEQRIELLNGTITTDETEYFSPHRVVTENPGMRTIVDLDAKTVTTVKKNDRIYTVKTFADLDHEGTASSASPVIFEPTGKTKTL